METFTFKLNMRENRILLSTAMAPPAVLMDNSFLLVWFSLTNLCVILLMVMRRKLVRSEIN